MSSSERGGTCASCKFIGRSYWGTDFDYGGRTHSCLKENERRKDTMRPTGDFAEDFMRNWRTFFDAKAQNNACRYYEERPVVSNAQAVLLLAMSENGGKGSFSFFSNENRIATELRGKFVEEDDWARHQRKPSDGTRDYVLSHVGRSEVERLKAREAK
jgi:hypothetical protein